MCLHLCVCGQLRRCLPGKVAVTCFNMLCIPALFQHSRKKRCRHRSLINTADKLALGHTQKCMHVFIHRWTGSADKSSHAYFFVKKNLIKLGNFLLNISFAFNSTYAKQLSWHGAASLWHPPKPSCPKELRNANIPQKQTNGRCGRGCVCLCGNGAWWWRIDWIQDLRKYRERERECCVCVCVWIVSDVVGWRRWRGEEGRRAETGGMCFPSGPSGAAFHQRYPEGDPHCLSVPHKHHGVIMGQTRLPRNNDGSALGSGSGPD